MKAVATIVAICAFIGGTTAIAVATGGGGGYNSPPVQVQYKEKPGCGPDKTDGVAGGSGRHTGQPPKADNRQDCPNPPGQQSLITSNTSSSSTSTSDTKKNGKK